MDTTSPTPCNANSSVFELRIQAEKAQKDEQLENLT
jgi:hypothetical protein